MLNDSGRCTCPDSTKSLEQDLKIISLIKGFKCFEKNESSERSFWLIREEMNSRQVAFNFMSSSDTGSNSMVVVSRLSSSV